MSSQVRPFQHQFFLCPDGGILVESHCTVSNCSHVFNLVCFSIEEECLNVVFVVCFSIEEECLNFVFVVCFSIEEEYLKMVLLYVSVLKRNI